MDWLKYRKKCVLCLVLLPVLCKLPPLCYVLLPTLMIAVLLLPPLIAPAVGSIALSVTAAVAGWLAAVTMVAVERLAEAVAVVTRSSLGTSAIAHRPTLRAPCARGRRRQLSPTSKPW